MVFNTQCPSCHSDGMLLFYEVAQVPVHSVLLMRTRERALSYPKGDIRLGFCRRCGFISNCTFDPSLHEYSAEYEETQGFSPTFNAFSRRLAKDLIERYDLRNKAIVEIGCGKGEFITLLCELGENTGIGYDPSFRPEHYEGRFLDANTFVTERVTFVMDFFTEEYTRTPTDFICCKMTLEHIYDVDRFVQTTRQLAAANPDCVVFFQVPNATRVFEDVAFWDIYYEHCSYFSADSLSRLFQSNGFQVLDVYTDYDDQYLMLAAKPGPTHRPSPESPTQTGLLSADQIRRFADRFALVAGQWKGFLQDAHARGQRVVLWGGGSKAVAFLTTLGIQDEVQYVVDINPRKNNTYLAGTGHLIVEPAFLQEFEPDIVIIMNPVYRAEIQASLDQLSLTPQVLTVEDSLIHV
jgi:2-polyprenyl-3-methyl-5-hydroxy-6-metoxy-1,4-benzoquinol methylase